MHLLLGMEYLKHMGNAVANFLEPFGVDVDVNVEHKGERRKCTGNQPAEPCASPTTPPESEKHQSSVPSQSEEHVSATT